jgi:hypothetical protein
VIDAASTPNGFAAAYSGLSTPFLLIEPDGHDGSPSWLTTASMLVLLYEKRNKTET